MFKKKNDDLLTYFMMHRIRRHAQLRAYKRKFTFDRSENSSLSEIADFTSSAEDDTSQVSAKNECNVMFNASKNSFFYKKGFKIKKKR